MSGVNGIIDNLYSRWYIELIIIEVASILEAWPRGGITGRVSLSRGELLLLSFEGSQHFRRHFSLALQMSQILDITRNDSPSVAMLMEGLQGLSLKLCHHDKESFFAVNKQCVSSTSRLTSLGDLPQRIIHFRFKF